MAEPQLAALTLADRPQWAALRRALWPAADADELAEELEEALGGRFAAFGAFERARLIGFSEVGERRWGDGCDTAPVAWLEAIYVVPACRRRGVGRRLVGAAEAWARERGYRELGSDAHADNTISRLGHARWGFEETERLVMFRKRLQ